MDTNKPEEITKVLSFSALPAMIAKIEGRIKHIPQDQIAALETIHLMLEIINSYAFWVSKLKEELMKLDKLNKSQAEAIRSRGIIV